MSFASNSKSMDLHEKAAEAIDKRGVELIGAASKRSVEKRAPDPFPTRQETTTLTDKDIIGEPKMAHLDHSGRTIARYFITDGDMVGLFDEGYKSLRGLTEYVLNTKPFNSGLSVDFIEEKIFDWWSDRCRSAGSTSLSQYILRAACDAVTQHHLAVPLSSLEIEKPFYFGDILVAPMDRQLFFDLARSAKERRPTDSQQIDQTFNRLASELGHLTAIHVTVSGEPKFAKAHAQRVAFQFAELIRFMSPAAVSWNMTYACFPHGCQNHRSTTILTLADGKISQITQGLIDNGMFNWRVPFAELDSLMKSGFANYSAIFEGNPVSPFVERVAKSVGAFSEGVASTSVSNRLIYVMSSLEHLFLRSEQEPIQSGVADRIAFLIAKESKERREVVANFKKAYALRSKQVHHLSSVDDEETLATFFRNAWIAILMAIQQMPRFKTQPEFLDEIENVKYGTGSR